jgi:hypothetical protein
MSARPSVRRLSRACTCRRHTRGRTDAALRRCLTATPASRPPHGVGVPDELVEHAVDRQHLDLLLGTCGRIRAVGLSAISSSSTIHANHCCTARSGLLAVAADRVSRRCPTHSSTAARSTSAAVVIPRSARKATSCSAAVRYVVGVAADTFRARRERIHDARSGSRRCPASARSREGENSQVRAGKCVRPAGLEPAAKCLEGTCSVR